MSVSFDSKAGEMGYSGLDLIDSDGHWKNQKRRSISERSVRPAAVWSVLVLFLLVVILILSSSSTPGSRLSSTHTRAAAGDNTKSENLTLQWIQLQSKVHTLDKEKDTLRDVLKPERDALRAERDVVAAERDCLRAERDVLKPERDALRGEKVVCEAERDQLKQDREALTAERIEMMERNHNMSEEIERMKREDNVTRIVYPIRVCPDKTVQFQNSCYYISPPGVRKTWLMSKKACKNLNMHMVVIDSEEENDFVSKFYQRIWIGLSDRHKEAKWKWVDGRPLDGGTHWASGEPNNEFDEDCAELLQSVRKWNDMTCSGSLSFMCEM